MPWNKDPDKAFPARHPREPGGLRQDILDEIADHLACAVEREEERQENENEEAVWRRVLERFGNPDAIARKLWWDQMWEAVMRECIQTGVMVVVTIAVLAGLAMMTRLVAGVGTANDAMREAMKQVAASNENLAKAMAEQRAGNEAMLKALSGIQGGGGEKPDALELSTIEIVVRRGTPEGRPAPEVKVQLRGVGPNDGSLAVDAELDDSGRAVFERLYQGAYTLSFEDPKSGLFTKKAITIFAGKGAGEHAIVAPDVEPRPVHIGWNLPAYGRDGELLIGTTLVGTWKHEDQVWQAIGGVISGHSQTQMLGAPTGIKNQDEYSFPRSNNTDPRVNMAGLHPCLLSGDIAAVDLVYLATSTENAELWVRSDTVQVSGGLSIMTGLPSDPGMSQQDSVADISLAEVSEEVYSSELPEKLLVKYGRRARLSRNFENVPEEELGYWIQMASEHLKSSTVVSMTYLPEVRRGIWRDGKVYLDPANVKLPSDASTRVRPVELAEPVQRIVVLAVPEGWEALAHGGGQELLGVLPSREDLSYAGPENVLEAYVIRSDWQSQEWSLWNPTSTAAGFTLELDTEPYWSLANESIQESFGTTPRSASYVNSPMGAARPKILSSWLDPFFLPAPPGVTDGAPPVTGILLRWRQPSVDFAWSDSMEEENQEQGFSPCWIVTDAIDSEESGKPLTDIDDGRFHYDSLKPVP